MKNETKNANREMMEIMGGMSSANATLRNSVPVTGSGLRVKSVAEMEREQTDRARKERANDWMKQFAK